MTTDHDSGKGRRPGPVGRRPAAQADGETPLSRERIAVAAVTLLDEQGVEGLTMRRLADRLDAGVMSVYWHVRNKEDLLDLALDTVLADRAVPASGAVDWRADVTHHLEVWRATMLRHPWSASLLPSRALGRNMLGRLEGLARTLSGAGIADRDLNVAIWSLWNYVMGATVTRASFALSDTTATATRENLAAPGGVFPTIAASGLLLDSDWDGAFRKGLAILLDGLSATAARP